MPRLKPIAVFITTLVIIAAAIAAGLAALPSNGAGAEGGTLNNSSITNLNLVPTLNITYFNNYNLSVNVDPGGRTINNVSFVIRPQNAGVNNSNWDFLTNGTPNPDPNVPFTRAATNASGTTWYFNQLRPNNIYPEIAFIRDINSSPSNSRFWRDSYHLMHFNNSFDMGSNTSFFIEIYATPKTSPPLSVDMQVFVVGKGFNISAFESGNLSNEAWRDHPDVELVGTISQSSDYHHTHGANSSHFLIGFSTNSSGNVGNKGLDISGDFWIILTTGHQLQNRGWDLKYHAGCNNNNTWYKGSGTTFTLQSGCPDAHVHFARELPLQPYNGMNVSVVVGYKEGGTDYIFNGDPEPFYFSELPNLPPNPSAFTAPAPGIYQGNVTISWLPANDPNRDPVTYKVYLINESATEYLIDGGITNTSLVLNTSAYPDGFYDIRVEACDNEFCTPFNLLANFDEGLCEFFRIWNGDPEDGGIGTTVNPYLICDVCDLQNMKLNLSAHYALNNSINASATSGWNDGNGFIPIGNFSNPFEGSFDGCGYNISGLFINRSSTSFVGLFAYFHLGTLSNVSLIDVNITGLYNVGGLAGGNWAGTVNNSCVTGNVNAIQGDVGGLVGDNNGTVNNSCAAAEVSGNTSNVGGLVGDNDDSGSVSNSYATGNVSGDDNYVGGLVGYNYGYGTVNNSYATGNVNGYDYIGGLLGYSEEYGSVSNSYATGNVIGDDNYVGGLVGWNDGSVYNCSAAGDVQGDFYIGGLIGNIGSSATVNCSYAAGDVDGSQQIGGLAGGNSGYIYRSCATGNVTAGINWIGGLVGYNNYGDISDAYATCNVSGATHVGGLVGYNLTGGTVNNSYATGYVSGNEYIGGLVGDNLDSVSNSFWDMQTSNQSTSDGGTGKTTSEMKTLATFNGSGWDIEENTVNINNGYPYLSWQTPGNSPVWYIYPGPFSFTLNYYAGTGGSVTGNTSQIVAYGGNGTAVQAVPDACYHFVSWNDSSIQNPRTDTNVTSNITVTASFAAGYAYANGSGTIGDPWLITNVDELQAINCNLSAHYALNNSIDAANTSTWNGGAGFMPVGNGSGAFTGTFDGRGYTVTGLFINRFVDNVGLFGYILAPGTVGNASLASVNISGNNLVGGLAGLSYGSVFNCSAAGNVSGSQSVGGLMGYNMGTVSNSSAAANVSGTFMHTGGLVGWNDNSNGGGSIFNSSASGTVDGVDNVGGLAGTSNGIIDNSSSTASVDGNDDVGGLVGANYGSVDHSSAAGNVNGTGTKIGGLAGYNYEADISNSGASGDVSGPAGSYSYCGGLVGYDIRGDISNSSAAGNVSGGITAGGLMAYSTGGNVSGSSATGNLSGNNFAGGLIGYIENGTVINCSAAVRVNSSGQEIGGLIGDSLTVTVLNCSASGNVSGTHYAGGLIGYNQETSVSDSVATGNVSITGSCGGGLIGFSHAGSSVSDSSAAGAVSGVGTLGGLIGQNLDSTVSDSYATGAVNGSQAGVGGLMGENYNGTVFNCSASGNVSTGDITGNSMAGGLAGVNTGVISSCSAVGNVSATGDYVGGLIGQNITGGSVSNCSAAGTVNGRYYVGGLAGENQVNGSIYGSHATGNTSGSELVGGLVGLNNASTSDSYATGKVTGNLRVGGFAGYNDYGTVNSSYSTGGVNGNWDVGGFVGFNNWGTVNNSFSTGTVSGTNNRVGGFVGTNLANVSDSYARGNVSGIQYIGGFAGQNIGGPAMITRSYSTGTVSGTSDLGGLVGLNSFGTVNSSFWDMQTSGRATSSGGTGVNTSEMKDFFTFYAAGWDLICESDNGTDDIWGIDYSGASNNGYPFLWWQEMTHDVSFTLNMSSSDGGNVSTPDEGMQGPYNCSEIVDIVATPDVGYFFVDWTGNISTVHDVNDESTTVTMFGDYSIQANFTNVMYNLSIASTPGGNVTAPGEGTYPYGGGHLVTINASPDPCYYFVSWTGDTGNISDINNPNTSITMNGNYSIQANFAINISTITATNGSNGSITPSGAVPVNCGNNSSFSIMPAYCYHIDSIEVNGSPVSLTSGDIYAGGYYNFSNVVSDYTINATFAINTSTLTYTAGAGGTVNNTTPQVVNCSENGSPVLAVADACYRFVSWNDSSTQNPRIDTATSVNQTFTANFAINTSTIRYINGSNGTITGTPVQVVNCGINSTQVTAVPDACCHFVSWNDSRTDNPRSDLGTSVNQTFIASFAIDQFTLTYNASAGGSITGATPQTVNCGADGTEVTANPDACYHFVNWSDGLDTAARTDTDVPGDITVTANFAIDQFTLTYTAGTGGTINGTTPQTVNCSANGSAVTVVPNAGYSFLSWSDSEVNASRTDTNVQVDITVTANFRRLGGGGGYSPPSVLQLNINIFDHTITALTDGGGTVQGDVDAISPDGNVSIHIPAGTTALFGNGSPLTELNVDPAGSHPDPPDGRIVIAAFDFHPDGATFDPAIQITVTYDPDALPEGTDASQLVIAFYNEATDAWEYLSGTVNPDTNTITFSVTHFTIFAVMVATEPGPAPSETPTPTSEPTVTPTVEPTPTVSPTATPTATAMLPAGGGDDGSDNRELLVIIIAACALLGALVGAIVMRNRKK